MLIINNVIIIEILIELVLSKEKGNIDRACIALVVLTLS
jgi:hypothetical protein